jgi:hypothetical protein
MPQKYLENSITHQHKLQNRVQENKKIAWKYGDMCLKTTRHSSNYSATNNHITSAANKPAQKTQKNTMQ